MKFTINELEKRYGRKTVLGNVTYTFRTGRVYGIYGAAKSGKTTLLDCIRGCRSFKYGELDLIDEENPDVTFEYSAVGMVHDAPVLPEFMTAYEFIKFFLDVHANELEDILPIDTYFDAVGIGMDERYCLIRDLNPEIAYLVQILCFLILPTPVILVENPRAVADEAQLGLRSLLSRLARESIVIVVSDDEKWIDFLCEEKALLLEGYLRGPSAYVESPEDDEEAYAELEKYMKADAQDEVESDD